uniref:Uncharacterized protein n=1 Tax=Rhizophagus irregularis (strain DAOM 181602 / DAOM 197198 / MUCL 43194) TaxID=747089 RepID=U9SIX9_RHIID
MQVYFYFAILSYYEKLREKNNRSGSNNGNGEVSASTYGAVSDQDFVNSLMNDVVNEIFLLGKVDIHPNIIKLCEVSKFIGKVVNENIGIIVATKLSKHEKAYGVTPYIDPGIILAIEHLSKQIIVWKSAL